MAATVWKGHLSFGLVSIPVRLFRAARAEKISFRQLHRTGPGEDQAPKPEAPMAKPISILSARGGEKSAIHEIERVSALSEPLVAPVRNTPTSVENAQPVPRSEIMRGYEYQPEQYVLVTDEELQRITPGTSSDIEIEEF